MLPSGASWVSAARGDGWRAKGFHSHWQTWWIWETSLSLELLWPLWLCNHGSHGSWVAGITFPNWRNRSLLIHKYLCALLCERSYWGHRWERHGLMALGEHYWQEKRLRLSMVWKLCYRTLEPTPTPTPTPPPRQLQQGACGPTCHPLLWSVTMWAPEGLLKSCLYIALTSCKNCWVRLQFWKCLFWKKSQK